MMMKRQLPIPSAALSAMRSPVVLGGRRSTSIKSAAKIGLLRQISPVRILSKGATMPGMAIRISDFRPRQRPPTPARHPFTPTEPLQRRLEEARRLLAEPFKGITTDGQVMPGLFGIRRTRLNGAH